MKKEPYTEIRSGLLFTITPELAEKIKAEGEQILLEYAEKVIRNGEIADET